MDNLFAGIDEDYVDPFSASRPSLQILSVLQNDVGRLETLQKIGLSVNVNNNSGNTPLHIAVKHQQREIFDYLLTVEDIRIDPVNFKKETPLMLACMHHDVDYYSSALINKGADVNVVGCRGDTPLHRVSCVKIGLTLLKNKARIDARDSFGKTPLFQACERRDSEMVWMLLCEGADPKITCLRGKLPLTVAIKRCNYYLQEILFNYSFCEDEFLPVNLDTFVNSMSVNNWELLEKIMRHTSTIIYTADDLIRLIDCLSVISFRNFRKFVGRFSYVLDDMFEHYVNFWDYWTLFINPDVDNYLYFFYKNADNFLKDLSVKSFIYQILQLCGMKLEIETVKSIICLLMSWGSEVTWDDLDYIYSYSGFSEIFEIMLHMRLADYGCKSNQKKNIIALLICDINVDLNTILKESPNDFSESSKQELLNYFAISNYGEFFGETHQKRNIPSLQELSRNVSRKYLIEKYNIKNNVEFFTMLKWLPISNICKDILSYKTKIY